MSRKLQPGGLIPNENKKTDCKTYFYKYKLQPGALSFVKSSLALRHRLTTVLPYSFFVLQISFSPICNFSILYFCEIVNCFMWEFREIIFSWSIRFFKKTANRLFYTEFWRKRTKAFPFEKNCKSLFFLEILTKKTKLSPFGEDGGERRQKRTRKRLSHSTENFKEQSNSGEAGAKRLMRGFAIKKRPT